MLVGVASVAGTVLIFAHRLKSPTPLSTSSTCSDPASINSHVYNPSRREIVKPLRDRLWDCQ